MSSFRRVSWTRGAGGGVESGDRLRLELDPGGALRGFLADASGHGAQGEAFWVGQGDLVLGAWSAHLARSPGPEALRELGRELNAGLYTAALETPGAGSPYLALLALAWLPGGALHLVTWGWGVHALVETAGGTWWPPVEERVGLKLGWLGPAAWERTSRACPLARLEGARRVLLLSDGFLGDDHRDPAATLELLREIGRETAGRAPEAAIEWLRATHPPDEDDATAAVIEV